jgi:hypothetical protein
MKLQAAVKIAGVIWNDKFEDAVIKSAFMTQTFAYITPTGSDSENSSEDNISQ